MAAREGRILGPFSSMPYSASQILRTDGPDVPEPVPPCDTIITTT
jgi:hypothetical protein